MQRIGILLQGRVEEPSGGRGIAHNAGVPRRLREPPRPARSGRRQARSEREGGGRGGERPARGGTEARCLELRRRGLVLPDRGLAEMPRPLVAVRDARQDSMDSAPGFGPSASR